jgi:hypothetical protein
LVAGAGENDLCGGAVRTVLATAFIAGCLAARSVTGPLPLVAPAVPPLLFDVRQVRLRPSQEMVFAELRLSLEARSGGLTADKLYARLSAQTQRQMPPGLTSRTSSTRYAGRASPNRLATDAWSCARQTTPGLESPSADPRGILYMQGTKSIEFSIPGLATSEFHTRLTCSV